MSQKLNILNIYNRLYDRIWNRLLLFLEKKQYYTHLTLHKL